MRNGFVMVVLLLLISLLLAGCTQRVVSDPGVVEIRTAYWGMVQESRVWEELAQRFNRKQKRIRVKLEHIAGQNYTSKVLAMTVGRCAPDVLAADDEPFRQLQACGLYEDLTPFLARESSLPLGDIYPTFRQAFVVDGKTYAIPYLGHCLLVYYNRDLRRLAGLPPDPDPHWTWEDFNRDAVALTRDLDGDGRKDQFALTPLSWFYCLQWVWSAGGRDMDPQMTRYVLDTPEARRGLQFHYDHLHKYRVCPRAGDLPNMNAEAMFFTGRIAMVITGSWWLIQARQTKNFEWDVAHMPIGPKGRATRSTTEGLAISRQSPHKEAAWEWIKFVLSEEGQAVIARSGRGIPALRSLALKTFADPKTPQHEERFLEAVDQYARCSSLHKHFVETNQVMDREWERVILGKSRVEDFLRITMPETTAIIRGDDL
jgi:multiple sugar transport system substrate-binding protein